MSATRTDTRDRFKSYVAHIRDIVENARRVLVVSHIDPDGDALGSQLAFGQYLRDLDKEVVLVRDSDIPQKYRFLPDVDSIVPADAVSNSEFDVAVVLECPSIERVGSAQRFLRENTRVISIDHHRDSIDLGEVNWVNLGASSVGEMVFEYFTAVGYDFDSRVATHLYTAILTDTGRFRFESTTPRTMAIAGELIACGANPRTICNHVYFDLSPAAMLLTGRVLATMEFHAEGRVCTVVLTRTMLEECGAEPADSDGLVDFTLFTRGVVSGALIKELDGSSCKVSLRSSDGVNVAELASRFGGGGHFNAAGCTIQMPLETARVAVVEMLSENYA